MAAAARENSKHHRHTISRSEGKGRDIDCLPAAADSDKAMHFVISHRVFIEDSKPVPAPWIKSVQEDKVKLGISSKPLEDPPAYEHQ